MDPVSVDAQQPAALYSNQRFSLWPDRVEEGEHAAHAVSPTELQSNYPSVLAEGKPAVWRLTRDISRYPQVQSGSVLLDALYNLSLEELEEDTNAEDTFDAGAKWKGVWTRDVSYSIVLALAAIEPERAQKSLRKKVKRDRIVQDTGTGGSWPVSSDRMTWALAAWEIYVTTGDRPWLRESYRVIRDSIMDDEHVVIDPASGLARGESTFLDWREQTYPQWMEPADIYQSRELGTNAVFYRTYRILAMMARELGETPGEWDQHADRIRAAINDRFWQKDRGYYGQYLYGRIADSLSPRSQALGEAFTILFDIADPARQDEVLRSTPVMEFGIPTVFPQTPNIPPYHNRSVWPFVQAYWNLAAAKRRDAEVLLPGLASIYRASALFLTNKENFVVETGSPIGTEINSDRQLWSVAANLAMTYRILFGMQFEVDGLHLNPVVPEALKGTRTLTNVHYRQALLSIEVHGFGSTISSFTLDGVKTKPVISASLIGAHAIVIDLDNQQPKEQAVEAFPSTIAPETPVARMSDHRLSWDLVNDAASYRLYRDGKLFDETQTPEYALGDTRGTAEYQVSVVDERGVESFLSAPVMVGAQSIEMRVAQAEFVTLDAREHSELELAGDLPRTAKYAIYVRYANGSGPVNTDNKCAVRTLVVDGQEIGPIVMPQRGQDRWDDWGASNILTAQLAAGTHRFELRFNPANVNMNGEINTARVSSMIAILLDA